MLEEGRGLPKKVLKSLFSSFCFRENLPRIGWDLGSIGKFKVGASILGASISNPLAVGFFAFGR